MMTLFSDAREWIEGWVGEEGGQYMLTIERDRDFSLIVMPNCSVLSTFEWGVSVSCENGISSRMRIARPPP